MRNIVIGGFVLGAVALFGCDDKGSGGNAAPATVTSAAVSAAPAPSAAPQAAASASSKPEAEKVKKAEGPKDHKALVKAIAEAWGSHDAKKVAALYATDAVVTRPGRPELKGHEAIEKRIGENLTAFTDLKLVPGRVWEKDKHTVVVEWVGTGTNNGDGTALGIPKVTNKPIGSVAASWIEVDDDGLVKAERQFMDGPTVQGQLKEEKKVRGVITAPPDGTDFYTSTARKLKEAKDDKEKAELAKLAEAEKKNVEAEDKFFAHVNGGKMDEALKLVAEDYKFVDYTEAKDLIGKKAFQEMTHTWMTAFPDLKMKSTGAFAVGDFVIEDVEFTGTQKGALGPIKATNKPVTFHQLEVDQLKDGKFVKTWVFGNSGELLSELGVGEPTPAPSAAPSAKK